MDVYKIKDMDDPYSNREIKEFFNEIKKDLNDIKTQTTKTNGRVSSLEQWKAYTTGAVAVLTLVVLPVLGYLALQVISIRQVQTVRAASIQPPTQ